VAMTVLHEVSTKLVSAELPVRRPKVNPCGLTGAK